MAGEPVLEQRRMHRALSGWLFERRDASKKEYVDGFPRVTAVGLNRVERFCVGAFVAVFTVALVGFWREALWLLASGGRFEYLLVGSLLPATVPLTVGYAWGLRRVVRSAWVPRDCEWCQGASTQTHTLSLPDSMADGEDDRLVFCSPCCRQCWETSNLEGVPDRFAHVQTRREERQGGGGGLQDRCGTNRARGFEASSVD